MFKLKQINRVFLLSSIIFCFLFAAINASQFAIVGMAHGSQVNAMQPLAEEYSFTKLVLGLNRSEVEVELGLKYDRVEELCRGLLEKSLECYLANQYYAFDGVDGVNQCHINAMMVQNFFRDGLLCEFIEQTYTRWLYTADKYDIVKNIFDESSPRNDLRTKLQILTIDFLLSPVIGQGTRKVANIKMLLGINLSGELKSQLANGESKLMVHAKRILVAYKLNFVSKCYSDLGVEMFPRQHLIRQQGTGLPIYPKFLGMQLFIKKSQRQGLPLILKIKTSSEVQPYIRAIDPQNWQWLDMRALSAALRPDVCAIVIDTVTRLSLSQMEDVFKDLDPKRALLAIAADFMATDPDQNAYASFIGHEIQTSISYANIHELERTPAACDSLYSYKNLYIEHIYPDSLEHVLTCPVHIFDCSDRFLVDLKEKLAKLPRRTFEDFQFLWLKDTRHMDRL